MRGAERAGLSGRWEVVSEAAGSGAGSMGGRRGCAETLLFAAREGEESGVVGAGRGRVKWFGGGRWII